jgi:hypothetical protein
MLADMSLTTGAAPGLILRSIGEAVAECQEKSMGFLSMGSSFYEHARSQRVGILDLHIAKGITQV